jgi:hypothetical protein
MKYQYLVLIGSLFLIYPFDQDARAQDEIIYVPGSTRKIEQMVGDYDNHLRKPTANKTNARYGIPNTDLGVFFEHGGKTYVAFGDIFLDDRV